MTNDRRAQIVTVAVLVVATGLALSRRFSHSATASACQDPQDAIYSMLNAARSGDVKGYLASYTGPLEAALRQTLSETTDDAFAKYLKDSNAPLKGIAVSEPQKINEREASVRVEYIYQDRNDIQKVYLEKGPSGWKIARADSDAPAKTLIPYGTPVK